MASTPTGTPETILSGAPAPTLAPGVSEPTKTKAPAPAPAEAQPITAVSTMDAPKVATVDALSESPAKPEPGATPTTGDVVPAAEPTLATTTEPTPTTEPITETP